MFFVKGGVKMTLQVRPVDALDTIKTHKPTGHRAFRLMATKAQNFWVDVVSLDTQGCRSTFTNGKFVWKLPKCSHDMMWDDLVGESLGHCARAIGFIV